MKYVKAFIIILTILTITGCTKVSNTDNNTITNTDTNSGATTNP